MERRRLNLADWPLRTWSSLIIFASLYAQELPPFVARVSLAEKSVFVGQVFRAEIVVQGASFEPAIQPFPSRDFTVLWAEPSGPVEVARPTGEWRFTVRLLANKVGNLRLPAFKIVDRQREARAFGPPIVVKAIPPLGRTAEFLGGVGRIEAVASAIPVSIVLGDSFDLEIQLAGPGAMASESALALPAISGRVQVRESGLDLRKLTRTLSYKVRPGGAGTLSVPAIRIAWFDPFSQRFQTVSTGSVRVEVKLPPPSASTVVQAPLPENASPARALATVGAVGLGYGVIWATLRWRRRLRRDRTHRVRQRTRDALKRLADAQDDRAFAREFMEGLSRIFQACDERTPRTLTPVEVRSWLRERVAPSPLAVEGQTLSEICDRILYSQSGPSSSDLRGRDRFSSFLKQVSEFGLEAGCRETVGQCHPPPAAP